MTDLLFALLGGLPWGPSFCSIFTTVYLLPSTEKWGQADFFAILLLRQWVNTICLPLYSSELS